MRPRHSDITPFAGEEIALSQPQNHTHCHSFDHVIGEDHDPGVRRWLTRRNSKGNTIVIVGAVAADKQIVDAIQMRLSSNRQISRVTNAPTIRRDSAPS